MHAALFLAARISSRQIRHLIPLYAELLALTLIPAMSAP